MLVLHRRLPPVFRQVFLTVSGNHLYSWVERGTVKVKCLVQEHNTMTRPGLEPGSLDPESSALTNRPPQGCALRVPGCLRQLTFAFGQPDNIISFI